MVDQKRLKRIIGSPQRVILPNLRDRYFETATSSLSLFIISFFAKSKAG